MRMMIIKKKKIPWHFLMAQLLMIAGDDSGRQQQQQDPMPKCTLLPTSYSHFDTLLYCLLFSDNDFYTLVSSGNRLYSLDFCMVLLPV